jgi:CRP-like cAMP-binding protein
MIEVGQLKNIATLKGVSDEALSHLADIMQKRPYGEGDPIFNEGTDGGDLYLVAGGTVKINKRAKEGEAQSLAVVRSGEFLGIMTFLTGGKHSASASAGEGCELYIIDKRSFDGFVEKFPAEAVKVFMIFIEELVGSLRSMNERYIDMVNYMWRWR